MQPAVSDYRSKSTTQSDYAQHLRKCNRLHNQPHQGAVLNAAYCYKALHRDVIQLCAIHTATLSPIKHNGVQNS